MISSSNTALNPGKNIVITNSGDSINIKIINVPNLLTSTEIKDKTANITTETKNPIENIDTIDNLQNSDDSNTKSFEDELNSKTTNNSQNVTGRLSANYKSFRGNFSNEKNKKLNNRTENKTNNLNQNKTNILNQNITKNNNLIKNSDKILNKFLNKKINTEITYKYEPVTYVNKISHESQDQNKFKTEKV